MNKTTKDAIGELRDLGSAEAGAVDGGEASNLGNAIGAYIWAALHCGDGGAYVGDVEWWNLTA